MKSLKHILLGAVIATFLICSLGFYDSWNFTDANSRLVLTYDGQKALSMYSTCASTDTGTSFEPVVFDTVLTGAGQVGGRTLSKMYTNVALGQWACAFKGYIDFGNSGSVSGLAAAILAEIRLPGALTVGGTYAALELEIVTQENGDATSTTDCFQWMQISGNQAATTSWEASSYLFIIKGLADVEGNLFDTNTNPTCDATLRILVGTTPYYILLSNSPTAS